MERLRKIFQWEYGLQKHHVAIVLAVLFSGPYFFVAYTNGEVPNRIGQAFALVLGCLIYGIYKASQSERITIAAWSFVSLFGFSGLGSAISGPSLETTASIALTSISAVGLLTLSLAVILFLLEKGYNKYTNRNGGEPTAEHRVLSESEYEDFAPHPYEDELSSLDPRIRPAS